MADNRQIWMGLGLVGAAVAGTGLVTKPAQGFSGLLIAAVFGLMLALGAILFLALNGVVRARWYRPIVAAPVQLARTMPVPVAALAVALLFGSGTLYPWAQAEVVDHSHLLQEKTGWLNVPFFLLRAAAVVAVWLYFARAARRRIGDPDGDGLMPRRLSALFLLLLAPTLSVASWDWTMSLEPEWFSTMWAVYGFSGAFTAGIAAVALLAMLLDRRGLLPEPLAATTLHDLGKLLFAFTSFWGYIWFCQYMLIWYANLPEEATWFAHRTTGGWTTLFWLNPILNWAVPFVVLMSARVKRDRSLLAQVAMVVLVGRWLDTYLMVGPAFGSPPAVPVFALAATLAVLAGMWLLLPAGVGSHGRRAPLRWAAPHSPARSS